MRTLRHITVLAVTLTAIGASTSVAGAFEPPNLAGSAGSPAARFVPERVWQQINDAMVVKLTNRQ